MRTRHSLVSIPDHEVVAETRAILRARCENTADLLDHLAEIDERRLFLPAAYTSMYAYCIGELGMSEDSAAKTTQAIRCRFSEPWDPGFAEPFPPGSLTA